MFLNAFTDELVRHGSSPLVKTARMFAPRVAEAPTRQLLERMTAAGALGSTAMFGAQKAKAGLSGSPWDEPQGTMGQAALKGAGGGALAAALIALLGRLGGRKR